MSVRLIVLASGRGSNFEAILNQIKLNKLDAEIVAVFSDKPEAKVLETARANGLVAKAFDAKAYETKVAYEGALVNALKDLEFDLVILAGYMRVLGETFLEEIKTPIMNIHPSLLPSFTGLHAQKQALDYGVKYSGCTVHFVDSGLDTGPIIKQSVVEVLDTDTEQSLSARILEKEHLLYSEVISLFAENKLDVVDRKVFIKD